MVDKALDCTLPVTTIRVAIEGPLPNAALFVVQRLRIGQPLPPNTREAMLVLTGDVSSEPLASDDWTAWGKTMFARLSERLPGIYRTVLRLVKRLPRPRH